MVGTDMQAAKDPKGLIRESYAIEGITESECRSVFLDWALSLGPQDDVMAALRGLIAAHAAAAPDHPMSGVLRDALAHPATPMRRGGRRARLGYTD